MALAEPVPLLLTEPPEKKVSPKALRAASGATAVTAQK